MATFVCVQIPRRPLFYWLQRRVAGDFKGEDKSEFALLQRWITTLVGAPASSTVTSTACSKLPKVTMARALFSSIGSQRANSPSKGWLLAYYVNIARSRFKTRFRRENVQFCRLARSENEAYLENILSLSDAARRKKSRSQQKLGF